MDISKTITRRAAVLGMGALSIGTVVPVAMAARKKPEPLTPEQRLKAAVAEILDVMSSCENTWSVSVTTSRGTTISSLIEVFDRDGLTSRTTNLLADRTAPGKAVA